MGNVATVQAIYEAFGRADVATILEKLDDAVEWETTSPPPTFNFDRAPIVTEATHSYAHHTEVKVA